MLDKRENIRSFVVFLFGRYWQTLQVSFQDRSSTHRVCCNKSNDWSMIYVKGGLILCGISLDRYLTLDRPIAIAPKTKKKKNLKPLCLDSLLQWRIEKYIERIKKRLEPTIPTHWNLGPSPSAHYTQWNGRTDAVSLDSLTTAHNRRPTDNKRIRFFIFLLNLFLY